MFDTEDVTDIRHHTVVPKQPIEKIHFHQRFAHRFKRLCSEFKSDDEINEHIFIDICDINTNYIYQAMISYKDFVKRNNNAAMLNYINRLPVISYKTKRVRIGEVKYLNYKLGLEYGYMHEVRLKYLPDYYVNHIFYLMGFINDIIYDQIISNDSFDACTVIGKESYDKMMNYIKTYKNTTKFLKTKYKIFKKIESDNSDKRFLEWLFIDLCCPNIITEKTPYDIFITPSYDPRGNVAWYVISRKNPCQK